MLTCDNRCYRGGKPELCALFDLLLRLQELLDLARCIVSAQGFAFDHCTFVFLAFFSLKFSLRAPTNFAVEKSFLCIHRSPFFGALIFPVSQKYTLPHKVYVGRPLLAHGCRTSSKTHRILPRSCQGPTLRLLFGAARS